MVRIKRFKRAIGSEVYHVYLSNRIVFTLLKHKRKWSAVDEANSLVWTFNTLATAKKSLRDYLAR